MPAKKPRSPAARNEPSATVEPPLSAASASELAKSAAAESPTATIATASIAWLPAANGMHANATA